MTRAKPSVYDLYVCAKLREIREKNGGMQLQIARELGISAQQYSKHERGIDRLSLEKLIRAATFLGVPVTDFFEGLPPTAMAHLTEEFTECCAKIQDPVLLRKLNSLLLSIKSEERGRGNSS